MNLDQSINALENFITDFDLKDQKGVVSFTATIHLFDNGHLKVFENNVQIITSNHLDTIYIVYKDNSEQLPDMFEPQKFTFTYVKRECLRIRPLEANHNMVVAIFPRPI